tara:strand:+ start:31 stop:213 length:183 start_codon:yes stop_codon:yes gene_type:complete
LGGKMNQDIKRTELEERLISVIDNFILWYSTEGDRGLAEEYMDNEHVDYNEIFELKKEEK